jgi:hypothetical protein
VEDHRDTIEIIVDCAGADTSNDFDGNDRYQISIRNSFQSQVVSKYHIANPYTTIKILATFYKEKDNDTYYHEYKRSILFSFDRGFGVVVDDGWSDMTFSGFDRELLIHESHDFNLFDKLCLTDELRDRFKDYLAERALLDM